MRPPAGAFSRCYFALATPASREIRKTPKGGGTLMTGHSHSHAPSARAGARHRGRLKAALVLVVSFLVVQLVAGIIVGSLALLSDAGHMATDALGLGMALAAVSLAGRQDRSS